MGSISVLSNASTARGWPEKRSEDVEEARSESEAMIGDITRFEQKNQQHLQILDHQRAQDMVDSSEELNVDGVTQDTTTIAPFLSPGKPTPPIQASPSAAKGSSRILTIESPKIHTIGSIPQRQPLPELIDIESLADHLQRDGSAHILELESPVSFFNIDLFFPRSGSLLALPTRIVWKCRCSSASQGHRPCFIPAAAGISPARSYHPVDPSQ